jgi:hypothetical protein
MRPKAKALTLISTLVASPALAASVVVVDQVGPGSIEVRQDQSGNSVEVYQSVESKKSAERKKSAESKANIETDKNRKPKVIKPDFQRKVLTDPYITERGRARAIIGEQTGTVPPLWPDDSVPKKNANSIRIYQEGSNNKAVTLQEGEANILEVDQKGEKNSLKRTQKGEYNRSRVIVNGEVVEDEESEK